MALWLWLRFFLMLFVLNVSIQHAEPTKLRLKKGKTQAAGEKKAHLFVPVPINFEGTRTVEHRCMMPVPVGNAENVLYLHIHEGKCAVSKSSGTVICFSRINILLTYFSY